MRAVSNTSPLSNLAIIDRLYLVKQRYGVVHIPTAVDCELSCLTHGAGKLRLTAAFAEGWLWVKKLSGSRTQFPVALDLGETEAIALALELKAEVLLIDEKPGRAARQCGLTVAGVLGVLLHGKLNGSLPSLKQELKRLRGEAVFFIDHEIERFILSEAGE
jgi:predicted nucleic acid-binding protein